KWTLTLVYFIPGVRHLSAFVAGASKLEFALFALFAFPGALLWTATFVLLGNFLGESWKRLADGFGAQLATAVVVLLVAAGVYFLIRWRRSLHHPRPRK
ncbi:MAG: hypothetical protein HGA76_07850, partial [Candidatus Firestonebacteria bacterium]|nr:hypothetical protein [Candidatus Firestonebacteria bacterium]